MRNFKKEYAAELIDFGKEISNFEVDLIKIILDKESVSEIGIKYALRPSQLQKHVDNYKLIFHATIESIEKIAIHQYQFLHSISDTQFMVNDSLDSFALGMTTFAAKGYLNKHFSFEEVIELIDICAKYKIHVDVKKRFL